MKGVPLIGVVDVEGLEAGKGADEVARAAAEEGLFFDAVDHDDPGVLEAKKLG